MNINNKKIRTSQKIIITKIRLKFKFKIKIYNNKIYKI